MFKQREKGESLLDPDISFPQSSRDNTLSRYMAAELWEANGNSTHYIATLMRYYQKQSLITSSELRKIKKSTIPDNGGITGAGSESTSELESQLQSELSSHDLKSFADMINKDYLAAFDDTFDWLKASTSLINDEKSREYYKIIIKKYPSISLYSHLL